MNLTYKNNKTNEFIFNALKVCSLACECRKVAIPWSFREFSGLGPNKKTLSNKQSPSEIHGPKPFGPRSPGPGPNKMRNPGPGRTRTKTFLKISDRTGPRPKNIPKSRVRGFLLSISETHFWLNWIPKPNQSSAPTVLRSFSRMTKIRTSAIVAIFWNFE